MSEIIGRIKAINLGLEGFGDGLRGQGVSVDQIKWKPPINAVSYTHLTLPTIA